ncbi:hypothetical protein [uncultured Ruminobacter sp.]|uniref:hypothetical protein n=1 Tax=uncultured Ruminobacter sp. TaxID=538947 RepID=UPI0025DADDD2|nr:hypothetical protein [uncultured Ruminobacter sp.]
MVKHKLTDLLSPDDVYEKFFAYGRLVIIHKATWCDMTEAEECILKSGKIPFLAHVWRYFIPQNREIPKTSDVKDE